MPKGTLNPRMHKERSQPKARKKLGLLEKHKDYALRAKDFNKKKKRLQALRRKAALRNPDEFNFKMVTTQTKGGVHQVHRKGKALSTEQMKNLQSKDVGYLNMKLVSEKNKVEKLQSQLHFLRPIADKRKKPSKRKMKKEEEREDLLFGGGGEEDDDDDDDDGLLDWDLSSDEDDNDDDDDDFGRVSLEEEGAPKHTIFVDDQEQVQQWDAPSFFDTPAPLVGRAFNRPRSSSLASSSFLSSSVSPSLQSSLEIEKQQKYNELLHRMERITAITEVIQAKELQKKVMSKGKKTKKVDKNGKTTYVWARERKR